MATTALEAAAYCFLLFEMTNASSLRILFLAHSTFHILHVRYVFETVFVYVREKIGECLPPFSMYFAAS